MCTLAPTITTFWGLNDRRERAVKKGTNTGQHTLLHEMRGRQLTLPLTNSRNEGRRLTTYTLGEWSYTGPRVLVRSTRLCHLKVEVAAISQSCV